MRSTELAKTDDTAIDPYTDPQCLFIAVQGFGQQVPLGSAAAMYLTRRLDRAFCVLSLTDRKIEELAIWEYDGLLNKTIGDAIMAVSGWSRSISRSSSRHWRCCSC